MQKARHSLAATAARGWITGSLLFVALASPPIEAWAEQSLVVHHFAHWLMVVAGALIGYQWRDQVRLPGRALVAGAGLGVVLLWHLPSLLSWADADRTAHVLAHATLVLGGGAIGWAMPWLSDAGKAYLFIIASVVMWPLVLTELGGGFTYSGYPGQTSAAGVGELVAMPLAWVVLAVWGSLHSLFSRPVASATVQALFAAAAVTGWAMPF